MMERPVLYYPLNSFWHTVDPRSKLFITLAAIATSFIVNGLGLIIILTVVFLLYFTAKLPFRLFMESLQRFKWILLVVFFSNLLFSPTATYNFFPISLHLLNALKVLVRFYLLIVISLWLNYVTKPALLIEGLTRLLKPFLKLFPFLDFSLIMGMVLRFIPDLNGEIEEILIARKIRGISKVGTSKLSQVFMFKSILIPIFVSSLRKSAVLAVAMEARGYRPGAPRSSMAEISLQSSDYLIFISLGLLGVAIILMKFSGWIL